MNVEHIQSFLAVGRSGSFRDAARERGLSQPAVSRQVQALERHLSARLLVRRRSGCHLTPEGRRFLDYAELMVRLQARVQEFLAPRRVAVGASSNIGIYLLPALLRRFEEAHPEIAVDLSIGTNETIARELESGAIDLGLMEWRPESPGLVAAVWRREPLVLIVPPGHSWAGRQSVSADQLFGEKLLGGERGTGTGALLRRHLGARSAAQRVRQLGSTEAVKEAVKNQLGVSLVMASSIREEVAAGLLRVVRVEGQVITKRLFRVTRASTGPSPPLDRFVELIRSAGPATG